MIKTCFLVAQEGEKKLNCQYFNIKDDNGHVIFLASRRDLFALVLEFLVIILF